MLRAAAAAERAGFPAVSLVASGFLGLAQHVARGLGMEKPAIAVYRGLPMTDSEDEVRRKVRDEIAPGVVDGLTKAVAGAVTDDIRDVREIVCEGTLVEVQDRFYAEGWTDGLPIVPPTRAAVAAMLACTPRAADEVIGVLPTANGEATVWNTAVNGVMAGCRPEYMPLLIAIVEAIADPGFRLEDAGATPGWEPLVIVSGPVARLLDFNHGTGVMRSGRMANSTVGRFLKLVMRNVAGIRIPPGDGDKGSIGANFNVALAEDEDAAAALGWRTFGQDRGYDRDDSVATVQSVVYATPPIYSGGETAEQHLELIADVFGQTSSYRAFIGVKNHSSWPLLVIGPGVANTIAAGGYDKARIRRYLFDRCTMTAGDMERYAWHGGHTTYDIGAMVRAGEIPSEYLESDAPDRRVRIFVEPDMIGIVVAGDPGRNQSKGYINNHIQGAPVSRRIDMPPALVERLRAPGNPE